MATTSTDAFTRADSGSLGNDWTDAFFFPAANDYFSIVGNLAQMTRIVDGPDAGAVWATPGSVPNWLLSVDIRYSGLGPWMGLIARATSNNTFYFCIARSDQGPDIVLRKRVGGVTTQLGQVAFTWPVNTYNTLQLGIEDTTLRVFALVGGNVTEVLTATDASIVCAGQCGMYAANGNVGTTGDFDNFSATASGTDPCAPIVPTIGPPGGMFPTPWNAYTRYKTSRALWGLLTNARIRS